MRLVGADEEIGITQDEAQLKTRLAGTSSYILKPETRSPKPYLTAGSWVGPKSDKVDPALERSGERVMMPNANNRMKSYFKDCISEVNSGTVTKIMRASFVGALTLPVGIVVLLIVLLLPVALSLLLLSPHAFSLIFIVTIFQSFVVGACLGLFGLNIFIVFVVLPIFTIILPRNYFVQQFGLLLSGAGIAFLLAINFYSSTGWGIAGAMGGLIASAAYSNLVRDLWALKASN